jgi:predicted methyltransferase
MQPVLSHYQAKALLAAQASGETSCEVSADLELTLEMVRLEAEGAAFAAGETLDWEVISAIVEDENGCYVIQGGEASKIQFFSETTGRSLSLYPTIGAPTMLVSGIPMHRIKDTDPHRDTLEKIRSVKPLVGRVLDTTTGLGYTAIEAARTATEVITVELDPAALEVARHNPWSQALFTDPRIVQMVGDSFDVIQAFEKGSFTRLLHDPPVFSLAGDLYSGEFYTELYRVLRSGGRLFHYVGDPQSKSGRNVTAGVMRRLQQAGFREVRKARRAFGVVAVK